MIERIETTEETFPAQRPVLVFFHIPKTGGTTLTGCLNRRSLGAAYHFTGMFSNDPRDNRIRDFLALPQRERDEFDFLHGHVPWGVQQFLSRPCEYITLLRDPLSRAVSLYFQSSKNKGGYFYKLIKNENLTLEDYLKSYKNDMIKWLHGINAFEFIRNKRQEQFHKYWRTREVTSEMLEKVKTNLQDHFMLVGTTERLSDFMFLLSRKLGWGSVPFYTVRQVNPLSKQALANLRPNTVSEFLERNSYDMELYTYARHLFERQWERLRQVERLCAYYHRVKNSCY